MNFPVSPLTDVAAAATASGAGLSPAQAFISELLAPIGWQAFIDEYFDREPMHISGHPDAFAHVADAGRIRALIESGVPWQFRRLPEMYLDGKHVPHADLVDLYTDMDDREARAPRLGRIRSLLLAGATVNSFGQEAHFPEMARIRREFAAAFGAEVECATFYSQKDHQGLAPHYDCVEIFVLQISGHKRWYVSSQRVDAPLVGHGKATRFDSDAPHAQMDLGPGDLLYLPRGVFHQACALSEESLHLTVAVKMPMYVDLLAALAASAPELEALRHYLPVTGPSGWASGGEPLLALLRDALCQPQFEQAVHRRLATRARI